MPIGQIDKRDHSLVLNPVEGFGYTTYGPWKKPIKVTDTIKDTKESTAKGVVQPHPGKTWHLLRSI